MYAHIHEVGRSITGGNPQYALWLTRNADIGIAVPYSYYPSKALAEKEAKALKAIPHNF